MYQITYDEHAAPIVCQTAFDLDRTLDELAANCEHAILVDIHIPDFLIQIGLGLDPTFVFISSGHENDGDYVVTVGDKDAVGAVDVFGCGGHTQVSRRHLVRYSYALRAVREFVESGTRLSSLCWEDYAGRRV